MNRRWLAAAALPALLCHGQPAPLRDRFLPVAGWTGTFSMTTNEEGSGTYGNYKQTWKLHSNSSGTVQIDQRDPDWTNDTWAGWIGTVKGTLTVDHSWSIVDTKLGCNNTITIHGTYPIGIDTNGNPTRVRIIMGPDGATYNLELGTGGPSVDAVTTTTTCILGSGSTTTKKSGEPWFYSQLKVPLPQTGVVLSGAMKLKEGIPGGVLTFDGTAPKIYYAPEITWNIAPVMDETQLVVEPKPDASSYRNWRPKAGADESSPGNTIQFRARVLTKDGKDSSVKAKKFRFELIEVSREPGISMNMPPAGSAGQGLDLKFDEQPPMQILNGGLIAETAGPESTEASATITSYDWGGYGTLKVTAELTDGRLLTGHLDGEASTTDIKLPKRASGSRIADIWKQQSGTGNLPDASDDENDPVGDGHAGDGLTLYEEYRGVHENKAHIEGNPAKKDYFLVDQAKGIYKAGIARFAAVTGLEVHHRLLRSEISPDRVINFNVGGGPHRVDQHAVVVVVDRSLRNSAVTFGGVGTPRQTRLIGLPPLAPGFRFQGKQGQAGQFSYAAGLVAHELLHTVNVDHHGEEDKDVGQVRWTVSEADGAILENGKPIRVMTEKQELVPPNALNLPGTVYIGGDQGTHSGVEDCLMRYDMSNAYIARGDKGLRYFIYREQPGFGLCDKAQGDGVNLATRSPQSRYGDADISRRRGACKRQICVNDAVTHASR